MSIAGALIVNAGSTSVKLTRLAHGRPRASPNSLDDALDDASPPDIVLHRIVHGATARPPPFSTTQSSVSYAHLPSWRHYICRPPWMPQNDAGRGGSRPRKSHASTPDSTARCHAKPARTPFPQGCEPRSRSMASMASRMPGPPGVSQRRYQPHDESPSRT
jgi:hypothetical protein